MGVIRWWWAWLNDEALWLLFGGLIVAALWNWWKWRRERALAQRLRARESESVSLRAAPKVSVLVAAWNEGDIIQEHVESFLRLRYPNKELILCAGGPDGTYELARRYAGEQVVVLKQRPGEGKQGALRRCLGRASGDIIFLTDADCLLDDKSFMATLHPLLRGDEYVVTGSSQPISSQRKHPFVVYQWALQLYSALRTDSYTPGLLGRNCSVTREALLSSGGFDAAVSTGTDYYLARQLLRAGFNIKMAHESLIETKYPERIREYIFQQSRWLRNLLLHGYTTGDRFHVIHALLTGFIGLIGLSLPVIGAFTGRFLWAIWLWLMGYSLMSRARYLRIAYEAGVAIPWKTVMLLPAFVYVDWLAWASGIIESLIPGWRKRW